jgi:hypothetical protein
MTGSAASFRDLRSSRTTRLIWKCYTKRRRAEIRVCQSDAQGTILAQVLRQGQRMSWLIAYNSIMLSLLLERFRADGNEKALASLQKVRRGPGSNRAEIYF